MKKGILINEEAGTGKVMLFKEPHTQSQIFGVVDNKTECEIVDGPMPTADHYPGIYLYKVKVNEKTCYANAKYVKVKK